MVTSEKTDKLFPALFAAKQELGPITKNAKNPHYKNNFADLNAHIEYLEPVLTKHGLMIIQPPMSNDAVGGNTLLTVIVHAESGQFLESSLNLVNVPDMQKVLGGITYARRGSMNALFNLASTDDDGETSVGRGSSKNKPAVKAKTVAKVVKTESAPAPAKAAKSGGFAKPTSKPKQESSVAANKQPTVGGW